jgi:hypothetical protein
LKKVYNNGHSQNVKKLSSLIGKLENLMPMLVSK